MEFKRKALALAVMIATSTLTACGDSDDPAAETPTPELTTYTFASKFVEGESSVSYSGQIARHVLIAELNNYIGSQLQIDLGDGTLSTKQDVLDILNKYYRGYTAAEYTNNEDDLKLIQNDNWDNFPITITSALQTHFANISSSNKFNLPTFCHFSQIVWLIV